MRNIDIFLEIKGESILAGSIFGENYRDACFSYSQSYLDLEGIKPVSISLPLGKNRFTPEETRNFFEGLLPEGFSRRSVAQWAKTDENDYLSILECLGKECLGAIKINNDKDIFTGYEWLNKEKVKELAAEGASYSTQILVKTHLSLTGASGKVGLYYDELGKGWYLPTGQAPSNYIVKQSHVRHNSIVLNEQICMLTAKNLGIEVPNSFVINMGTGKDEDVLFATKRYDRLPSDKTIGGLKIPYRLHQEDFAQALGISASNKYERDKEGYLARMFKLIGNVSSNPIEDQIKLWDRVVFNYLIGNTDCHIKNYSLVYDNDFKGIRLAPAYDIICTRAYNMTDDMSYYIGNCINIKEIDSSSFEMAAAEVGIGKKMAMKRYESMISRFDNALSGAVEEMKLLGFEDSENIGNLIKNNCMVSYIWGL